MCRNAIKKDETAVDDDILDKYRLVFPDYTHEEKSDEPDGIISEYHICIHSVTPRQ